MSQETLDMSSLDINQEASSKFSSIDHLKLFHKNLAELRDNNGLMDFEIVVDEKIFPAHKLVLAASSDYFKAMFSTNSKETTSNRIEFKNISASTMESILEFCYTCNLTLTTDNIEDVLMAASLLLIESIQRICIEFIKERIDVTNCLGVVNLAERCSLSTLFDISYKYVIENFDIVVGEKEFPEIDEDILARIIQNDELNISETNLFQALIRWVDHDKVKRSPIFDRLVEHVRFIDIEPKRLVSFGSNNLVRESQRCRALIELTKDYLILLSDPDFNDETMFNNKVLTSKKPRDNLRNRQRIYLIGGWKDLYKAIATAEMYDPNTNQWTEIKPMAEKRCGLGCAVLGDFIYAVGGHDGQSYLNSVERYDTVKCEWLSDVASMNVARTSVGIAVALGYIYAIGGQTGKGASDCVEKYDPVKNEWSACASLNQKKLGAGVTVLNDYIYVVGGAEVGETSVVFSTVERYNPKNDTWTYVAPMITARKHFGCTSHRGKIYAIGGRCGGELGTAEVYDPLTDSWSELPMLHMKRQGLGAVELGGYIYAIGGQLGETELNVVEAYDTSTMEWNWKAPTISERLAAGVAVHPLKKNHSPQDGEK